MLIMLAGGIIQCFFMQILDEINVKITKQERNREEIWEGRERE